MSFVHDFGAKGDGEQDDTAAIQHCVEQGDGVLEFARGDFLITAPIELDMTHFGRLAVSGGSGTAKIINAGAGPAFRFRGDHAGTAGPGTVKPEVWHSQRMPVVENIEIEGRHEEADGIQLTGTMQAIVRGVALRSLQNGLHIKGRNRNIIIDGCHIYHNTAAGIWIEGANLHQTNIVSSHISYNRLGGIRIERSEVHNLQITGNDIEYNTSESHGFDDEESAEIYVDTTAEDSALAEVTIASNTIQATRRLAGANLRIIGPAEAGHKQPELIAVTGNVIGSQNTNVHLRNCYGVSISGNSIYSAEELNVLLENCRQVVLGHNHSRRHTPPASAGMKFADCRDLVVNGCHLLDESADGQQSGLPLLELVGCQRVTMAGCQLVARRVECLVAADCEDTLITGCTVIGGDAADAEKPVLRWTGQGKRNRISGCQFVGAVEVASSAGVRLEE